MVKKKDINQLLSSLSYISKRNTKMFDEKEDITKKLENILKLLDAEENNDDNSQMFLVIDNFYNNYRSLCGSHENLLWKLKKTADRKEEVFNSSESIRSSECSDSESNELRSEGRMETLSSKMAKKDAAFLEMESELRSSRERVKKLESENGTLRYDLESARSQRFDLNERIAVLQNENEALMSENLILSGAVKELEDAKSESGSVRTEDGDLKNENCGEIARLKVENSKLQQTITEMNCQKSELEKLVNGKGENDHAVVKDLRKDIEFLRSQKSLLEDELGEKKAAKDMTEYMEGDLNSKVSFHERMLNRQKARYERLSAAYKLLEQQYRGACVKNEIARGRIEDFEAKDEAIRRLNGIVAEKEVEISGLVATQMELIEKLNSSMGRKDRVDMAIGQLNEVIQTLEFHLRLANQRVKVTSSEYKERDETLRKRLEELQEKHTRICEDARFMKGVLAKEVHCLSGAFGDLEAEFVGSWGYLGSRISKCLEEVRIMKEVGFRKSEEFERRVRELEIEGRVKDDEKREAIKQLCLVIDYYRQNCDRLSNKSAQTTT